MPRVELLGHGWDNTAFLADDAIVFRFPRKQTAVELLETEARVLPRLAPRLPLPIPLPEWFGQPSEIFQRPFIGHRLVPGRTAGTVGLTQAQRTRAAPVLAEFLATLHAIPAAQLPLPPDLLARGDFLRRLPLIVERLEVLQRRGIIAEVHPWMRLFDEADPMGVARTDAVVHGDLYACHLLVDAERRLAGVIDWGDVHRGDPAIDLMVLYAFIPPRARASFVDTYGTIDARVESTARLRAAFHCISVAWYGVELRDVDIVREARTGMDFVLRA